MKVGIVGPGSSCRIIEKNIKEIDQNIKVKCYPSEQVNTSDQVAKQCDQECDTIIFTGCAVERFVLDNVELTKPYTTIEKSIISVANAFLEMQKHNLELDAFSIDVVENQVIEDLLDAFNIQAKNIYHCPFQPEVLEADYVKWHENLQDEGKSNVALTAFAWVYNTILKDGYHAIYLGPTRAMVRLALERIKKDYALNKAEYSKIAVEIIQISNYEKLEENYYSSMMDKVELEKSIIQYAKSMQGSVFSYGRNEYVIFTNSGILVESQNRLLKMQKSVEKIGIKLNVGIGKGVTAYKADMNARKALNYSLRKGKMEIYQIDENDMIEGPLGKEQILKYELISSDPRIQQIAEETGLSVDSILKIIAIAETRKSYIFDAQDLADCLDVTVRSARRIMNKIMESGYGKVYAKETAASGGRPKKLIEILFK